MRVFDSFKSKDIDKLSEWFDKYVAFDNAPYLKWWDKNYCKKCVAEIKDGHEYGWCELHNKCKFFKDMAEVPSCKEIIKMWLESEDDYGV